MPKGAPQAAIQRINATARKVMEDQVVEKRLAEIGADIPPLDQRSPEALGRLVAMEIDKWVPLIKAASFEVQ
jgi:tripartite-type tricarboxylate transporter receptor subunit TctC